jgi:hypothetical protein
MLLKEIESIDFISKSNATFTTLLKDWSALIRKSKPYLLGTIGKFRIGAVDSESGKIIVAYDLKADKYAAFLQLDKFSKAAYAESIVAADPAYRGINLPLQMYSFLILDEGMIIVSDEIQTKGARSIWEKLAKEPGIDVYGYNTETKKVFQIDPDDLFNEDVYDEGLNQEIEHLENEEYELQNARDDRYFQVKKELEKLYAALRETKNHVRLFAARAR